MDIEYIFPLMTTRIFMATFMAISLTPLIVGLISTTNLESSQDQEFGRMAMIGMSKEKENNTSDILSFWNGESFQAFCIEDKFLIEAKNSFLQYLNNNICFEKLDNNIFSVTTPIKTMVVYVEFCEDHFLLHDNERTLQFIDLDEDGEKWEWEREIIERANVIAKSQGVFLVEKKIQCSVSLGEGIFVADFFFAIQRMTEAILMIDAVSSFKESTATRIRKIIHTLQPIAGEAENAEVIYRLREALLWLEHGEDV